MREQEANILLLLNSIEYNILSFHSGDVGQTARPREREKSNIRTQGRVHKVKSHSLGHECLIKIPTPARPPSPPGITLIGALPLYIHIQSSLQAMYKCYLHISSLSMFSARS